MVTHIRAVVLGFHLLAELHANATADARYYPRDATGTTIFAEMGIKPLTQYKTVLPSGVRVDRLPLGFANGHWWMSLVFSGPPGSMRALDGGGGFYPDWLSGTVQLRGPHGPFSGFSGGGGGSGFSGEGDVEFDALYKFEPIPTLTIAYMHEGSLVDEEHLDLTRH